MVDTRTPNERRLGYPPGLTTVTRRCTVPICGSPNSFLFEQVTRKLIDFLNTSGIDPDDLFAVFTDTAGSFTKPSFADAGPGRWLRHFGKYPDRRTVQKLIDAKPSTWLDIIRVEDVGPDTFYDMFRLMTVRWVHEFGECLGVFTWPDGLPIAGLYFGVDPGPDLPNLSFVRTDGGLPFNVDDGSLFVFPTFGEYTVRSARPTLDFPDETITYGTSDLEVSSQSLITVIVRIAEPIQRIGVAANSLRIDYDAGIAQVSIHPAQLSFPAKHRIIASGFPPRRDKNGNVCGKCEKFAFIDQADLENPAIRGAKVDPDVSSVTLTDLPSDRYVVAGYSEKGTIGTTERDVVLDDDTVLEVGLDKAFDLSRLTKDPPERALLRGDIVQQNQRGTEWCGPFSLAHAFSYWAPHRYNPRANNGRWAGETIRDQASTWLHIVVGFATLGLSHLVIAIFADDPVPGTLQETLVRGCHQYGFSSQGLSYKSLARDEALKELKRWIYAGIPVIVTVDEKMDQGAGHWTSEHYKTLVGYDDNATLRYTDDAGAVHTSRGAFYFTNSGIMGETRDDPDVLSPELRETHPDYEQVPIGNDADSYTVFWKKWQTGSIPTFSKSHWCLPVFPVNFERVYK
jgi:hypothetical protein